MRRILLFAFLSLLFLPTFFSCRRNLYKVNVAGVKVSVEVKRLEKDLFTIDPAHLRDSIVYLNKKYDSFLKYFGYVINIGEPRDSSWMEGLVNFCTDKSNNEVFQYTMTVFPDVDEIQMGIADAFRHYRYYFPSKKVPAVFTCITGFNNSIITGDSVLAISLDKYLGPENKFYKQLGIYKYQLPRMSRGSILPDCMYGWASSEWSQDVVGYAQNNALADVIHEGKLLFFVRSMLPALPEEKVFGFSQAQMKFCLDNEGGMWQYLVEHNLLFTTDMLTRKKLTGEAPFTVFFTSDSPGRAAAWLGFRIVESYMSRNSDISLEKLMTEKDVQQILEKARYRPTAGK